VKKITLLFILIFFTYNIVAQESIIIAVPSLGYPISYIDNEDKPSGFFIELIQKIFQNSSYKLEYKYGTFSECLNYVKNGEADLITMTTYSKERDEYLDFCNENIYSAWSQVIIKRDSNIEKITDLRDKKIGIMVNDSNAIAFESMMKDFDIYTNIIKFNNFTDIENAIMANTIDAGISTSIYNISNSEISVSNIIFNPTQTFVSTTQGKNASILSYIDNELTYIKNDKNSYYYDLINKYFIHEIIIKKLPIQFYITFAIICFISIMVFFWLFILKKTVKNRTKQLIESEKKLIKKVDEIDKIISYMPIAFAYHEMIYDENKKPIDYKYININENFYKLTGYPKINNKLISEHAGKDVAKIWAEHWEKNINEKIFIEEVYDPYIKKWFSTSSYPIEENKFVVMFDDITDKKIMNLNLEKLAEERSIKLIESEKMASIGRTVTGFTHEINTPIGVALTASSFLFSNSKDILNLYIEEKLTEEKFIESLNNNITTSDIININLNRAAELIRSLKDISTNHVTGNEKNINIKDYFNIILLSLKPKFKNSNFICKYDIDDIIININPGYIFQIFTNLIVNSIDHGFNNRDYGNIYIRIYEDVNKIYIIYRDDGCGILEENLAKIFEPFFTTKRGNGEFTGLGLSIVYNLVEKINGKIEVKNVNPSGAEFSIIINKK